jgi:hypothetical protein
MRQVVRGVVPGDIHIRIPSFHQSHDETGDLASEQFDLDSDVKAVQAKADKLTC